VWSARSVTTRRSPRGPRSMVVPLAVCIELTLPWAFTLPTVPRGVVTALKWLPLYSSLPPDFVVTVLVGTLLTAGGVDLRVEGLFLPMVEFGGFVLAFGEFGVLVLRFAEFGAFGLTLFGAFGLVPLAVFGVFVLPFGTFVLVPLAVFGVLVRFGIVLFVLLPFAAFAP
jgi:hypothetical protein